MDNAIITIEGDSPRFRGSVADRVVTLAVADLGADLPGLVAVLDEVARDWRAARIAAEKAAAEKAAAELASP